MNNNGYSAQGPRSIAQARIIMRTRATFLLLIAISITLGSCASESDRSTPAPTATAAASTTPIHSSQPLVSLYTYDGLLKSQTSISRDGAALRKIDILNGRKESVEAQLPQGEVDRLAQTIDQTDFSKIYSRRATPSCPPDVDAAEIVYTFYPSNGSAEVISNCTAAFDSRSPIFKQLHELIEQIR